MQPVTLAALSFGAVGLLCVGLVVVGLPGAWIMLAIALLMELFDPSWLGDGASTFGWPALVGALVFASVGEVIELVAGVAGAKAGGGSRRAAWGALIGGFVGALAGTPLLPLIGTLIGAVLGTFVGAYLGETTGPQARSGEQALKPAIAATLARLVATVAKVGAALAAWALLLGAALA